MAINFRFVKDAFGHINGTSFVEQTEQALNEVAKLPQDVLDLANLKIEQIDIRVGQAQAAASAAESSASASSSSATTSQKWAEGSDADVTSLGGTHSAKGWVESMSPYYTPITTVSDHISSVNAVGTNVSAVSNVSTNMSAINTANANATNINAVATNIANVNSVANNETNIDTVAGNLTDISAVAAIDDDVSAVATNALAIVAVNDNKTNINAVNSNKTNIDSVVTNASAINNVSTNLSAITTANANATNINTVATNIEDVSSVADISSAVSAVASNASNINAVNSNSANINAVNANKTNIDTVASKGSDVTSVATKIADVSSVAAIADDVATVADSTTNITTIVANINNVNAVGGNISNVNAVAGNTTNINAVNSNKTNIDSVAGDLTNINAVAADLTNIDAASGYATQAQQYAIGEPSEPSSGHSSKWFSEHMALVPKGTYSASTTYAKNEWVRNQVASTTSCYVSLVDDNVGNPLTDTSKWMFMFSVVSGATISWGNIEGLLANQTDLQTALDAKATTSALTTHTSDTSNPHSVSKAQVGLGNVDNTSDLSKPISTATQSALDEKADASTTLVGYGITDAHITNGVITLGDDTITPLTQHQSLSGYATESWVEGKGYLDSSSTLDATKLSGTASINTTGNAATATTATSATSATTATNYSETGGIATALSGKQATISDLADIRSGAALGATAKQPASTLSGYGIADAKIAGGVITLGSNTITPLTSHQDISGKANLSGATFSGAIIDQQGYPVYGVPNTPEAHNCLYRGKEHTVEGLSAKVLANDFSDIFIGDYFKVSFSTAYGTVSNQKVLVAGINYFKNCGDSATPTPHLVMIPETSFGSAAMNATNTTEGAYAGSAMHTTVLPAIATALKNAIGASHVVAQRRQLSNAMTAATPSMAGAGWNGASTGWGWTDCDLCLMSEPMVYGTMVLSSSFFDVGDRKQQLPIFALNPQLANIRSYWWLSSVADSNAFAGVYGTGYATGNYASYSFVVRPLLVFR